MAAVRYTHRRRLHGGDGGDRPHGQKVVRAMPSSRTHWNFVMSLFESKMCSKITYLSLCQWQKLRRFQPKNALKRLAAGLRPDLPRELTAPPDQDLLVGFKECGQGQGNGEWEKAGGVGLLKEVDRGRSEGTGGEEGREERKDGRRREGEGGGRNLAPRSFLKVGANGYTWSATG